MDELLRRWAELEPGALGEPAGGRRTGGGLKGAPVPVSPGEADEPGGQGRLLHALWDVVEARGWRWVMLFAPVEEDAPPYLARVSTQGTGEGQTRRGRTPGHALLAAYVALLERQAGKVSRAGGGA
ncbi:hypothetical protein [Deinococcus apachensis]|uniref:hypothetical protein n=1 Tax=Deinococcus apachensis TaxID=309886 RepID=UPI000380E14C|nr:hypothetical protein [Deinococcus apachensis]